MAANTEQRGMSNYLLRSNDTENLAKKQNGAVDKSVLDHNSKNTTPKSKTKTTKTTGPNNTGSNEGKNPNDNAEKDQPKSATPPVTLESVMKLLMNIDNRIEKRIDGLEEHMKEWKNGLHSRLEIAEEKINNIKTDVVNSLEYQSAEMEELKTQLKTTMEVTQSLQAKIDRLENDVRYGEYRSRKYNLLIYGVPEEKGENILKVINNFLSSNLHINKTVIEALTIANAHRIPHHPNSSRLDSPSAIIVKFVKMADKMSVLQASYRVSKLPNDKTSVRTDLPSDLKKSRSILSTKAYEIRKNEHYQTRIRESFKGVWLEVRKDKADGWKKIEAET